MAAWAVARTSTFGGARGDAMRSEQADAEAGQVLGFIVAGRSVCAQASMSFVASLLARNIRGSALAVTVPFRVVAGRPASAAVARSLASTNEQLGNDVRVGEAGGPTGNTSPPPPRVPPPRPKGPPRTP